MPPTSVKGMCECVCVFVCESVHACISDGCENRLKIAPLSPPPIPLTLLTQWHIGHGVFVRVALLSGTYGHTVGVLAADLVALGTALLERVLLFVLELHG